MRKFALLGLMLFLFGLSSCDSTPSVVEDVEEGETVEGEVTDPMVTFPESGDSEESFETGPDSSDYYVEEQNADEYHIVSERLTEAELAEQGLESGSYYYRNYLSFGESRLLELPFKSSGWNEYSIYDVLKDGEKDIVFTVLVAGCGGCAAFRDEYYLVDPFDLSIETVDFVLPPVTGRVSPRNAMFHDYLNEMALVVTYGDLGEEAYYEEIWVYLFDKNTWQLAQKIDAGETVMCQSMGYAPNWKNLHYWKDALIISPVPIDGDLFCLS